MIGDEPVVNATQPQTFSPPVEPTRSSSPGFSLLDPELIQSARQIYQAYYEVHPGDPRRPTGIAISRRHGRGKLIYTDRPILLPQETFIPLDLIETHLY